MSNIKICTPKIIQVGAGDHVLASLIKSKLWNKDNTITIGFLNTPPPGFDPNPSGNPSNMDPLQAVITKNLQRSGYTYQDAIKEIVEKRIKPLVSMNIQFVDNPRDAMIKIKFTENEGSSSYIGTDCLIQNNTDYTMNFSWFGVPTVIHEFGHAMGMIHEHQNPRGNKIKWNTEAVYRYFGGPPNNWDPELVNQNIFKKYSRNQTNGSSFDPDSIMLYAYDASLTENNCCGTKQNGRLSETDIRWLRRTYPKRDGMSEDDFVKHIMKLFYVNKDKQNCVINPWGPWGSCSVLCGGGTKTRSRTVKIPASGGGDACPVLTDRKSCNTAVCVKCDTGPWGPWGSCSASCGGGTKTRSRTVKAPPTTKFLCSNKREEKEDCNTGPCSKMVYVLHLVTHLVTGFDNPINLKSAIAILFLVILLVVLVAFILY